VSSKLDKVIGHAGRLSGVYHFTVPRVGELTEQGGDPARYGRAIAIASS
jgi:hypothetical protein